MARTYRDRGHTHPENGSEQRLDALLDVLEEIRDRLPKSAEERPGQVRLREGDGEAEAGPEETPAPAARPANPGGARRSRR